MDRQESANGTMDASCLAIVEAVADQQQSPLTDPDIILHEHIRMDAVAQLLSHHSTSWTLSFALPENTISIKGDGRILIDGELETTVDV